MGLLIGDLLADAASVRPRSAAATFGDLSVTYSELDRSANRYAHALAAMGVTAGDVVAWWSPPSLSSLSGFAAAARLGAVFAPLNPALGAGEASAALDYLQPRLLVAGGDLTEAAGAIWDGPVAGSSRAVAGSLSLEEMAAAAASDPVLAEVDDGSTHIIYLTSGTTGTPKGVEVSHRASWLRSFPGGSTFAAGLRGDGGILPSFPLFHYGGWHYVLEAWHHRCAFHMCDRFDGATLVAAASRWRPSAMYCIPAVWERVLASTEDPAQLSSVLHADTGTSAAPPDLIDRLRAAMPQASTSILYGSSEGGHHTTLHDREVSSRPGSVGRVAPPGVVELAADGEILYRSPTLMSGYHRLPEQTASALAGGWYHTGDLGVMDDDGYLYITGRKREVIRTGGETVAPSEVEAALAGYPGVLDLAVVGVADPAWGEVVALAVVPAGPEGAAPGVEDVRAHVAATLAPFKQPRLVVALPSIPRTAATGQVQRTLLKELVVRELGHTTSPAGVAGRTPGPGSLGGSKLL